MPSIVKPITSTVKARKGTGAYVKTAKGYEWKPRSTGRGTRNQDAVSQAMTSYRRSGGEREILNVSKDKRPARYRVFNASTYKETDAERQQQHYAERKFAATEKMFAVKYRDAEGKVRGGWLTREGKVIGEDDVLRALEGLDRSAGLDTLDEDSLLRKYLEAGPKERAKMVERLLEQVDWDDIFKEIYQPVKVGKQTLRERRASDEDVDAMHQRVWNVLNGSSVEA